MLISEVLRILDKQEVPQRETVTPAAEPFFALLSSPSVAAAPTDLARSRGEAPRSGNSFSSKSRAEPFPIEQRSYDSFLRALEESTKSRGTHALDLFQ